MWKNSKRFPRLEVDEQGNVRLFHAYKKVYIDKKYKYDKDGYGTVQARDNNGISTTVRVHRLVAEAFIPNPENKPVVNHINGIKDDNRVDNLEWATIAENTQHGYDKLGVLSAASKPVLLLINNTPYSTYRSITHMSKLIGINRDTYRNIEYDSNGYFKFIEDYEHLYTISSNNHNLDVWKGNFRINLRGTYFYFNGVYYDKITDIARLVNRNRSTVNSWIEKGHPQGLEFKTVSCREFLENTQHKNW